MDRQNRRTNGRSNTKQIRTPKEISHTHRDQEREKKELKQEPE